MPLADNQFSFGGITFGDSTRYAVLEADGFDVPPVKSSDIDREEGGEFIGWDRPQGRIITLTTKLYQDTPTALYSALDTLKAAMMPPTKPSVPLAELRFKFPGAVERMALVRPRRCGFKLTPEDSRSGLVTATLEFKAPDWRFVNPTETQVNFTYGQTQNVTNNGNVPAWVKWRVDNAWSAPKLTNNTNSGYYVRIDRDITAGNYLEVDHDLKSVSYDGSTANRAYMYSGSTWFLLLPGVNNLSMTGSAGSGTGWVKFRDSWA